VIYPNTTSLRNLEYQSIVQISPTSLPAEPAAYYSTNGVQFNIVSGPLKPPYSWSASSVVGETGSGLPPGLSVSSNGLLYGVTTATGTYDFTLTVTDSSPMPQSVQWTYSITLQ
jgi:beta-glucosidase